MYYIVIKFAPRWRYFQSLKKNAKPLDPSKDNPNKT